MISIDIQDGFFEGELMDGRRGLVPSNFVEKVPGKAYFLFIKTFLFCYKIKDSQAICYSLAQAKCDEDGNIDTCTVVMYDPTLTRIWRIKI